jgi:hypothetical protein
VERSCSCRQMVGGGGGAENICSFVPSPERNKLKDVKSLEHMIVAGLVKESAICCRSQSFTGLFIAAHC